MSRALWLGVVGGATATALADPAVRRRVLALTPPAAGRGVGRLARTGRAVLEGVRADAAVREAELLDRLGLPVPLGTPSVPLATPSVPSLAARAAGPRPRALETDR